MTLAIIQTLPNHPRSCVRTDSFAKFQKFCGMIEQTSYLAAHAACHATMNGIRSTMAIDADITNIEDIRRALNVMVNADEFDCLVLPGLTDESVQDNVCSLCDEMRKYHEFRLFLDPIRHADIDNIVQRQKNLPDFATLTWPYLSTVTPGRRDAVWLPATCVVSPLYLNTAPYLKGVHELDRLSDDDTKYLSEHAVAVLNKKIVVHRTVIGLENTPNKQPKDIFGLAFIDVSCPRLADEPPDSPTDETGYERLLLPILDENCAEVIKAHPVNNSELWGALARTATSILMKAQDRGLIQKYHVRCDAETASWGTPEAPVIEILIEYPKRVREVRFSVKPG